MHICGNGRLKEVKNILISSSSLLFSCNVLLEIFFIKARITAPNDVNHYSNYNLFSS